MFGFFQRFRRRRLLKRPFPEEWLPHLERRVPFFRRLPEDLRQPFFDRLKVFAWEKRFTGARGMEITDEVRAVISAIAARLILHLDSEYYDDLTEVVVYPFHYKHPDAEGTVFGEAHTWGVVVLSWPAVLNGLSDPRDGHHTAIHEFAHVLDVADGSFDGTPELRAAEDYRPWAEVLGKRYAALCNNQRRERKVLREYGALNPAEFFAVATESFFEKPVQMKKNTPDLYEELRRFYGFDPASDGVDGVPSGTRIGRNDPCPCGRAKKYKHCCGRAM
jgi:Mlc titration factor MtfA (ptsG expression regulator)